MHVKVKLWKSLGKPVDKGVLPPKMVENPVENVD